MNDYNHTEYSYSPCNMLLSQSEKRMWPIQELNPRPPACKSDALPTKLIGLDSSHTL